MKSEKGNHTPPEKSKKPGFFAKLFSCGAKKDEKDN
jgi:hypothetical protein